MIAHTKCYKKTTSFPIFASNSDTCQKTHPKFTRNRQNTALLTASKRETPEADVCRFPFEHNSKSLPKRKARQSNPVSFFNLEAPWAPRRLPRSFFMILTGIVARCGIFFATKKEQIAKNKTFQEEVRGTDCTSNEGQVLPQQSKLTHTHTHTHTRTHLRQYNNRTQPGWQGWAKPSGYSPRS